MLLLGLALGDLTNSLVRRFSEDPTVWLVATSFFRSVVVVFLCFRAFRVGYGMETGSALGLLVAYAVAELAGSVLLVWTADEPVTLETAATMLGPTLMWILIGLLRAYFLFHVVGGVFVSGFDASWWWAFLAFAIAFVLRRLFSARPTGGMVAD